MKNTTEFTVGQRVVVNHPTKSDLTYGYIRAIEADGTLTVYFPEIGSTGTGWLPIDFN